MNKQELIDYLREEGIKENILNAIKKIKRENFIPKEFQNVSYENIPLPIGYKATISQPYTIAYMLQELELKQGQLVLEIGTGSGYNAALISELIGGGYLYTTEIIPKLAESSKNNLKNFKNIEVIQSDGSKGLKGKKFDRIIQTAASEELQKNFIKQLKNNGIYLAPIGPKYGQKLIKVVKKDNKLKEYFLGDFIFVPLTH